MKILHIILSGFTEGMSYQENLLSKYHALAGHEVTILASCYEIDKTGSVLYAPTVDKTITNGIRLVRMNFHRIVNNSITKKIKKVDGVLQFIELISPDIIFFHGPQSIELLTVVEFVKKNPMTKLFIDNHADLVNSASNFISLNILHKIFWRFVVKKAVPYTTKFYGVLPARVNFLTDIYRIPGTKCELLVMGADDERVIQVKNDHSREKIRKKFRFSENDFVIITGGKIDSNKTMTINLLQAIHEIKSNRIRLIIFGSMKNDLKEKLMALVDNDKVHYIGWINSDDVYDYFAASDLAVFPGKHSVLWEEAAGTGLPCIFKYFEGFTHIDVGGNCRFLYTTTVDEIKNNIEYLLNNPGSYLHMKKIAEEDAIKVFSYKEISRKSIQSN